MGRAEIRPRAFNARNWMLANDAEMPVFPANADTVDSSVEAYNARSRFRRVLFARTREVLHRVGFNGCMLSEYHTLQGVVKYSFLQSWVEMHYT